MTFQGTVNLHPCVRLEHALLNTAVCHANHLAITAAKGYNYKSYIGIYSIQFFIAVTITHITEMKQDEKITTSHYIEANTLLFWQNI